MSREIAIANLALKPCAKWGHTEYSLEYHKAYLAERTGLPVEDKSLVPAAYDRFGYDFLWRINNGLIDWKQAGRVTDMGHASYDTAGADFRGPSTSPFTTPEEVWAFDAVGEYGLPGFEEQVKAYEDRATQARAQCPRQLSTGGYYRTLISGAIEAFGWDMLLLAAADESKFEKVLDGFFRRTLFFVQAWAKTSIEAFMQHDDFVWSEGPFLHPEFYRRAIIPRYAELWKPLHAAGKKVIFCSDGLWTEFAGDIVAAGADALCFEPCNDFAEMAGRHGDAACLIGSAVDCRDLTFGKWDQVKADIDMTLGSLARCKGAIVAVGNHLPPNVPPEMLDRYFDYLLPRLNR
jgi:hypothetical protein